LAEAFAHPTSAPDAAPSGLVREVGRGQAFQGYSNDSFIFGPFVMGYPRVGLSRLWRRWGGSSGGPRKMM